jgi:FkbM family methyltransferase
MQKTIEAITYDFYGDMFIDIGGNVGMWTTEMVDLYNKCIFVEPSEAAMADAKRNIEAVCKAKNVPFENVTFLKNICTDQDGIEKTIFATTSDTGNFSVFAEELYGTTNVTMAEEKIPTITLDSLDSYVTTEKDIFIKIDTEGSDLNVLLGGLKFIEKHKPTIFVEAHYHMYYDEEKHNKIWSFLKDLGYDLTEFKFPGYQQQATKVFDGKHNGTQMYDMHFQMVFIPPAGDAVQEESAEQQENA